MKDRATVAFVDGFETRTFHRPACAVIRRGHRWRVKRTARHVAETMTTCARFDQEPHAQ